MVMVEVFLVCVAPFAGGTVGAPSRSEFFFFFSKVCGVKVKKVCSVTVPVLIAVQLAHK